MTAEDAAAAYGGAGALRPATSGPPGTGYASDNMRDVTQRGSRTAAEVIAEREERLRTDPAYAAQVKAVEDEHAAVVAADRRAERPILEDLAKLGISLDTVWNLYKVPELREQALPVLLRHLVLDYPDRVLEGIGQGLADKSARPWWAELKATYLVPQREVVRDRLAGALAECAIREHYDDLLSFVANPLLGGSRIYFLRPINRIGNRISPGQGRRVIERLAQDPVLGREASAILKGLGRNEG